MRREVLWTPWEAPGLEHLLLEVGTEAISAEGAIIALSEGGVFRASYQITCDVGWPGRAVEVIPLPPTATAIHLHAHGDGRWSSETGEALAALDGCVDVDFAATPFTNTPPIQ